MLEYAVPIVVQGQGYPLSGDNAFQQQEVTLGIFLFPEYRIRHLTRGIIDGADQGEPGASAFQPVVAAAVDLQQLPFLRVAIPATAMSGCPPLPGTRHPCCTQNGRTVDRLTAILSFSAISSVKCCVVQPAGVG